MANSKHENTIPLECPESIFECQLCMEEFVSPRVLPCQHIFCKTCVLTLMKKSLNVNTPYRDSAFMCPVCRRECSYEVPRGKPIEEQISAFPESLLLKSLLEYRSKPAQISCINGKNVKSCGNSCEVAVQTTKTTKDKRIQVMRKSQSIGLQISPMTKNASVKTENQCSSISTQTVYETSLQKIVLLCRDLRRDTFIKFISFLLILRQYTHYIATIFQKITKDSLKNVCVVGGKFLSIIGLSSFLLYGFTYPTIFLNFEIPVEKAEAVAIAIFCSGCVIILVIILGSTTTNTTDISESRVNQQEDSNHSINQDRSATHRNSAFHGAAMDNLSSYYTYTGGWRPRSRRGNKYKIQWRPRPPFPL